MRTKMNPLQNEKCDIGVWRQELVAWLAEDDRRVGQNKILFVFLQVFYTGVRIWLDPLFIAQGCSWC